MNRLLKPLLLLFFLGYFSAYTQPGRLLLVGGGAEKNGASSWSTPAYRWAGEGKRVAIIGISTGTLAPYFMQHCGALQAKEFAIASHDSANSQATYDTLTSYDVIFFRGGDQYDYYNLYRNTKLQDAVTHVYGQGGTICGTSAGTTYSLNSIKLLADKVHIVQLLHGCTYDFVTGQTGYSSLNRQINTSGIEESGNYTILASGSNPLSDNQAMLEDLVKDTGIPSAEILLLSGDQTLAATFKTRLLELGATQVYIFTPNLQSGTDIELGNHINQATKILFLKNSFPVFSSFLGTLNGDLLKQRTKRDSMITAFIGDDARLAGKTVIENYLTEYASYYAELTFGKGLSLLRHTVLMPDTYLNSDIYENTATSVPYAMARDTLKYGIWLTNHNYMKFTPVAGKAMLTGYGTAPVMIIANAGTLAGFSSHTASGSTSSLPRMVAGFEHLQLSLIDYTTPYFMGNTQAAGIHNDDNTKPVVISPIPVINGLTLKWVSREYEWEIINLYGCILLQGKACSEPEQIDVSMFRPRVYFIMVKNKHNSTENAIKFVKQ
jgi:hypothetical protein